MQIQISGVTIECTEGDITAQSDLDAVVNAANRDLAPGGGVAGAIHDAAGPELWAECEPLGPIRPGQAVETNAYKLPNRRIIHCLGPVYGEDEPSDQLLAACYRNALDLVDGEGLGSIGFPAISTGAFGYPMEEAAEVAARTVIGHTSKLEHVRLVRFVLFGGHALGAFEGVLQAVERE